MVFLHFTVHINWIIINIICDLIDPHRCLILRYLNKMIIPEVLIKIRFTNTVSIEFEIIKKKWKYSFFKTELLSFGMGKRRWFHINQLNI